MYTVQPILAAYRIEILGAALSAMVCGFVTVHAHIDGMYCITYIVCIHRTRDETWVPLDYFA